MGHLKVSSIQFMLEKRSGSNDNIDITTFDNFLELILFLHDVFDRRIVLSYLFQDSFFLVKDGL